MLQVLSFEDGGIKPEVGLRDPVALAGAKWIDLFDATPEEMQAVERAIGAPVHGPEEVDQFYISDQVQSSNGNLILKALLLTGLDKHRPTLVPVTFMRTKGPLVTISTGPAGGLAWLAAECQECLPAGSNDIFPAILDMVIDHATNVLDHVSADIDRINRLLFQHHATPGRRLRLSSSRARRYQQLELVLTELGYCREVLVKLRRSVLSFRRLLGLMRERLTDEAIQKKLAAFEHELSAIAEAEVDLSNGAGFMLDGAVGYITTLQGKTMNTMTIAGLLLTPPVLVASIYGMNFRHMPELAWEWGYAWALGLMVLSAAGMYLFARTRRWL